PVGVRQAGTARRLDLGGAGRGVEQRVSPAAGREMKICVVALGKIGLPLAVQFASKGHTVIGADIAEATVATVNAGQVPFPGEADLDVKLKQAVDAGLLR